jgi:3D (Asp-Asp-Asp) domain-containing protein
MNLKNNMHIGVSAVTVAAMLMNGSVHRVPEVEFKTKAKTEDYVVVDYDLEDQQILQTKVEVRKQEYIKEQIEEERQRLKKQREEEQRLREQERKRQEQLAREKEQNKQTKLKITATAYTSTCKGCTGITATGYNVRNTIYYKGLRIIATDNAVVPLYSIVLVEARNETFKAIVLDRGGGIKGYEADVLVENENVAVQFGRQQNVTITILKRG